MSGVHITGHLDVSELTTVAIMDEEAMAAGRAVAQTGAAAMNAAAPVGPTGRLARSHRPSVTKTPFGVRAGVRRSADAWYGRIVERGRQPGVSFRSGRTRRYPGARANPFVAEAFLATEGEAEELMLAAGVRAGERIAERL